jgi:DNA repair photolyase
MEHLEFTGIPRKSPTLHDFPYRHPRRKCHHKWIINVTPPGREHCLHQCLYCYARDAVYSRNQGGPPLYYTGLAERVERELDRLRLCPPVSLSNATDPCQPIPPVQAEVRRLAGMLLDRGVSLGVITKADPSFLLDLPGLSANPRVSVAVTIEGPPEILRVLSPRAPSCEKRLEALRTAAGAGVPVMARIDPVFPHLYEAVYGKGWMSELEGLVCRVADAGVRHVVSSTGTLNSGARKRVHDAIRASSPAAAEAFLRDYRYDRAYSGQGYRWLKEARLAFHRRLRSICEEQGMTYAVCIELDAHEADSPGLPHCEAFAAPFCLRDDAGYFHPLKNCTANCHANCRDLPEPPCGRPLLAAAPAPFHPSWLR